MVPAAGSLGGPVGEDHPAVEPGAAATPTAGTGTAPGTVPASGSAAGRAASHRLVGIGMVLLAATLWSVNGTVSKLVLTSGLSSLRLVEIRCVVAAVIFLAFAQARRPGSLRTSARELAFLAVYGVVGLALVQWLYLVSISRMPVSISLLIEFTAPLIVALWVRFVRKEPVRGRVWVALVLCLVGLALVAQVWAGLTLDALGLLCSGLAALCLAAYYMLGERALTDRDPVSLAAWSFVMAGVFWSVLLPWWTYPFGTLGGTTRMGEAAWPWLASLDLPMWALLAWIVVLGTVVPFTLILAGLKRLGATRVGLVGTAEPVMAGLVAWVLIGEVLGAVQILGGAVVLAGIMLAETARGPHPSPANALPEGVAP